MRAGILLIFFTFFSQTSGFSQSFDPQIESGRLLISGVSRQGFRTDFDFAVKKVQKYWWKFAREFGRPLNMKSYYQVTIPSTENSGNIDLTLLSKTMRKGSSSSFFLTIDDTKLPEIKKAAYMEQVKVVLQEFKKYSYIRMLEEQLVVAQKKAKQLSREVERGNESSVQSLMRVEQELQSLRNQLATVYLAWD